MGYRQLHLQVRAFLFGAVLFMHAILKAPSNRNSLVMEYVGLGGLRFVVVARTKESGGI